MADDDVIHRIYVVVSRGMPERIMAGHCALLGILCGGVLAYQYFMVYPQESRGMFDFWVKEKAEQLSSQEDWQQFLLVFHRLNYHERYFMVHRLGMTCKQANDTWWQLYHYLIKRGTFLIKRG